MHTHAGRRAQPPPFIILFPSLHARTLRCGRPCSALRPWGAGGAAPCNNTARCARAAQTAAACCRPAAARLPAAGWLAAWKLSSCQSPSEVPAWGLKVLSPSRSSGGLRSSEVDGNLVLALGVTLQLPGAGRHAAVGVAGGHADARQANAVGGDPAAWGQRSLLPSGLVGHTVSRWAPPTASGSGGDAIERRRRPSG